jgi:plasmid stabilization system protein ParE
VQGVRGRAAVVCNSCRMTGLNEPIFQRPPRMLCWHNEQRAGEIHTGSRVDLAGRTAGRRSKSAYADGGAGRKPLSANRRASRGSPTAAIRSKCSSLNIGRVQRALEPSAWRMKVVIHEAAVADLEGIFEWISRDNLRAATRLVQRIRSRVNRLAAAGLPHIGRPGLIEGTRELSKGRISLSIR